MMEMALTPYPRYRDVSLPWLDRLPAHWDVRRAKTIFRRVDVRSSTGEEELLTVSSSDGVRRRSDKDVSMFQAVSYKGHKLCWPGDLVINSLWAWAKGLGFSPYHGIVSAAYGVYRPRREYAAYTDYFHSLFRSEAYDWEFRVRSKGIWISRLQLTDHSFLDMPVILPPAQEAGRIGRFVKAYDQRMDRLVRAKRRLIALLTEEKRALIQRAVTRGLNPNAPLKPSGVEWLGDVPAHWEVRKLKQVAEAVLAGATPSSNVAAYWDGEIMWATPRDVSKAERLTRTGRRLTPAGLAACSAVLVPPGSIILTSRAPVGNVALAEVPMCTNQGCKAIVPRRDVLDPEFGYFVLRSAQPELQARATGTTFAEVSTWKVANLEVPVPPLDEQIAICAMIRGETEALDTAIRNAEMEIALLGEYRTRLITDVVTGKLDVRGIEVPDVASVDEDTAVAYQVASDDELVAYAAE